MGTGICSQAGERWDIDLMPIKVTACCLIAECYLKVIVVLAPSICDHGRERFGACYSCHRLEVHACAQHELRGSLATPRLNPPLQGSKLGRPRIETGEQCDQPS